MGHPVAVPRLLPFLIFLAVALTLVGGMHYYIWVRFVRDLHLPHPWVLVLTVAIIAAALAMPATLIAVRLLPSAAVRPAIWVAFIWMGVGFLLVAFLGIADAGRLVAFVIARVRGPSDPDPARRVLLARSLAAGVGGVVAGLSALGLRSALAGVQIKELDIKLRGLPRELAGLRLVQISDVHVGPLLRKDWVAHVVERVRSLSPDLPAALEGRDPSRALVLLAHQPRQFPEAARLGVPLTLCGHTHGGQIWPFSWIVALAQPYLAGLYRRGDAQLYVSRGTGFWGPPMRVFAPAEITLLRLQPA